MIVTQIPRVELQLGNGGPPGPARLRTINSLSPFGVSRRMP
jgi:hypothetical protein